MGFQAVFVALNQAEEHQIGYNGQLLQGHVRAFHQNKHIFYMSLVVRKLTEPVKMFREVPIIEILFGCVLHFLQDPIQALSDAFLLQ